MPPKGVRFAPSPTGRFHIGNLRTAWISHEWAKAWSEPWVVRFEDIDAPRSVEGAREGQLADMALLGLVPDQILIQSAARDRHWTVFCQAVREGRVYPCFCTRKDVREALEASGSAPHFGLNRSSAAISTYSGHCRESKNRVYPTHKELPSLAWRFAVAEDLSGRSDFIVARSSTAIDAQGLPAEPASYAPAYHWACAVDDYDGNYRLLVRAADLAEILPQQRAVIRWLAEREKRTVCFPAVFHTSLVTQNDGHRLEKRTRGATLSELQAEGKGIEQVLECFQRSWKPKLIGEWAAEKAFGEEKTTMTLQELGL